MYARTTVESIPGRIEPKTLGRLQETMASEPRAVVVVQLSGRNLMPALQRVAAAFGRSGSAKDSDDEPQWSAALGLRVLRRYALPNGRRYALLERAG